jgi:hypothetical protein
MKLLRNASGLALAVILSGTAASAYTLQQASKPAENPPASYRSDVYVDSRGCAYVRASIGSTVNWVPRLSSDRKTVICGLTPTAKATGMASARPPAPPAPPPPAALTAAAATTTAPAAAPAAPVAAPKPSAPAEISRTMSVTCPADGSTARVRIGSDTVAVKCAPGQTTAKSYIIQHGNGERTRLVANPAPIAAPAPRTVARVPATPMPAGSTARVVIGGVAPGSVPAPDGYGFGRGLGVSSGPGVSDPVPSPGQAVRRAPVQIAPRGSVPAGSYSVPPVPNAGRVVIPSGYRPAFGDDRLNPNRGPQAAYGDQQMAATWDTSKVPMREANPAPARGLIAQPDAGGVTLFTKSPSAVPTAVAQSPAPAAAKRYVQVGAFNVAANAQRAAARLQALGLPGRVVQTRSGRTVVVAGPYDSATALGNALATARSGGFSDAFLRN